MRARALRLLPVLVASVLFTGCGSDSDGPLPLPTATPTPASQADLYMRKGPYLMLTGQNTSMTVLWQSQNIISPKASIEWGADPSNYGPAHEVEESGAGDNEHQFIYTIKDLPEHSRTYYRVTIVEAGNGQGHEYEGSFMTPPEPSASSATFYAYGDTRDDPSMHNNVLHWIRSDMLNASPSDERQTFLLHSGDFVHRGLEEPYWDSDYFHYNGYKSTSECLKTTPVIGSVGNHECYTTGPVFHYKADIFRKYWPYIFYTTPSYYYSFDYGPVHFIILDVYTSEYKPGSAQYDWLTQELGQSSKPWTIVMFHYPPYDAGAGASEVEGPDGYANTDDIRNYLCPLFEQYGVKLVLSGHRHYYARSEVPLTADPSRKIRYLVLGGGGAPLSVPDGISGYVVVAKSEYHFARMEIAGTQLRVTILKVVDGDHAPEIMDQFIIE
ncbi:MAG: metallophosphoesterase family protein [Candidatus Binatia bacterium]